MELIILSYYRNGLKQLLLQGLELEVALELLVILFLHTEKSYVHYDKFLYITIKLTLFH